MVRGDVHLLVRWVINDIKRAQLISKKKTHEKEDEKWNFLLADQSSELDSIESDFGLVSRCGWFEKNWKQETADVKRPLFFGAHGKFKRSGKHNRAKLIKPIVQNQRSTFRSLGWADAVMGMVQ